MPSAPTSGATLGFDGPPTVPARGTVVLLTGRGEPPAVYERFGRRIAADAYLVRVVEARLGDLAATRAQVASLLADASLPGPRVLVGSDAGAVLAALEAESLGADAAVLAGLALADGDGPQPSDTWEEELELRTACPSHRRVLGDEPALRRGRLADPLPTELSGAVGAPGVPTLVLHGDADAVAPAGEALAGLLGAPGVEVLLVASGRHDVLNDVSHRSVAAAVVLFLERLRLGADLPAVVRGGEELAGEAR